MKKTFKVLASIGLMMIVMLTTVTTQATTVKVLKAQIVILDTSPVYDAQPLDDAILPDAPNVSGQTTKSLNVDLGNDKSSAALSDQLNQYTNNGQDDVDKIKHEGDLGVNFMGNFGNNDQVAQIDSSPDISCVAGINSNSPKQQAVNLDADSRNFGNNAALAPKEEVNISPSVTAINTSAPNLKQITVGNASSGNLVNNINDNTKERNADKVDSVQQTSFNEFNAAGQDQPFVQLK